MSTCLIIPPKNSTWIHHYFYPGIFSTFSLREVYGLANEKHERQTRRLLKLNSQVFRLHKGPAGWKLFCCIFMGCKSNNLLCCPRASVSKLPHKSHQLETVKVHLMTLTNSTGMIKMLPDSIPLVVWMVGGLMLSAPYTFLYLHLLIHFFTHKTHAFFSRNSNPALFPKALTLCCVRSVFYPYILYYATSSLTHITKGPPLVHPPPLPGRDLCLY